MSMQLDRRRFLQTGVAGMVTLGPGLLQSAEKKESANNRLHVGIIGVAGRGAGNLQDVARAGAAIVALCDVDENRAVDARKKYPKAKFYADYRRLFDQKGLDAVLIATPDHTHALPTLMALKAGLHVYCEKPLTHTVAEARLVAETAAQQKRVTQMGNQIHAEQNYRRVVELVQSGAVGEIREVHVWTDTSYVGGKRPEMPVPAGLNYDLWLGPAPYRPYNKAFVPFSWRGWWDFGGGALADMACHYMDLAHWSLKLHHPEKIHAEGPPVDPDGTPAWLIVHYEYPARESLPPVKLTWYHGGKRPPEYVSKLPKWGAGVLFVGEKGLLVANYGERHLLPEEKFAGFQAPKPFIANSIGHHKEWVEACKTGGPTTCNFGYGGALTETVLLGNVAYRSGKPITWDTEAMKTNEPEADRYLQHKNRKGWTI